MWHVKWVHHPDISQNAAAPIYTTLDNNNYLLTSNYHTSFLENITTDIAAGYMFGHNSPLHLPDGNGNVLFLNNFSPCTFQEQYLLIILIYIFCVYLTTKQ